MFVRRKSVNNSDILVSARWSMYRYIEFAEHLDIEGIHKQWVVSIFSLQTVDGMSTPKTSGDWINQRLRGSLKVKFHVNHWSRLAVRKSCCDTDVSTWRLEYHEEQWCADIRACHDIMVTNDVSWIIFFRCPMMWQSFLRTLHSDPGTYSQWQC